MVEAGRALWSVGLSGLHSKFHNRQEFMERTYIKNVLKGDF